MFIRAVFTVAICCSMSWHMVQGCHACTVECRAIVSVTNPTKSNCCCHHDTQNTASAPTPTPSCPAQHQHAANCALQAFQELPIIQFCWTEFSIVLDLADFTIDSPSLALLVNRNLDLTLHERLYPLSYQLRV